MRKRSPPAEDRPTDDQPAWKRKLYCIIFESKTPGGKAFDVSLLIAIGLSVTVVMLESVKSIQAEHALLLRGFGKFLVVGQRDAIYHQDADALRLLHAGQSRIGNLSRG